MYNLNDIVSLNDIDIISSLLYHFYMSLQVDYFPVGHKGCCGDAIAIRYWDPSVTGSQKVIIIDGGNEESAEKLVQHIIFEYGTNYVHYVFSTHLDADHILGLKTVLQKLNVGTLYMHLPWEHAAETGDLYKNILPESKLETKLQKSLDQVAELFDIAIEKDIAVEEVFTGDIVDNNIFVLGPSKKYYELLTTQFRDTPAPKSAIAQALETLTKYGEKIEEKIPNKIYDFLHIDLLGDGGETTAENNSSLILLFSIDGQKLLFTGDAGIPALTQAIDFADLLKITMTDLNLFHVPHHASKHNLGSSLLKRIKARYAIASASGNCKNGHPSKRVTNALLKVGTHLNVTREKMILNHNNAPRLNWSAIDPEPFYSEFIE
jgi:beta-lactamase superfamily II metal-dependent hydrolase